ncbi:MAG: VWA domain-containing protein [Chloroflexi bacterium]|nr:VWA domain-containing protein [Chloroflexota bacterium]MBV9895728.1 VWA domain-containing protein [Chloroflexota bacterium]
MSLLQPVGLWLLLALPVLFVLYLIQSRYRPHVVASLLLWKRMARDLEAEAAWRRPRWDLLLALQLLTAAAVAIALAHPAIFGVNQPRQLLVLDTSASMAARDVQPTRLAAAKQIVTEVANTQPPNTLLSLISAGAKPQVLVQDDSAAAVMQALDAVQADATAGDLPTALLVAGGLARGGDAAITVITDAAFNLALQPQSAPITFRTVGGGQQGLAVAEVSLRPPVQGSDYLAGLARVVNATSDQQTTTLAILADGVVVDRSPIQVPAASHADATFHVPSAAQNISVGLTQRGALPGADRVDLVGYGHWARNVVIVSDQPAMWQHVLSVVPNVTTQTVRPADFAPAAVDANSVYLFDNVLANPLPQTPLILVNPPDTSTVLGRQDNLPRQRRAVAFDAQDPLLSDLDIAPLNVLQLERAVTPAWAAASVAAEDTPLIMHGRLGQQPAVLFAFDPNRSNLPHLAAFPQLMSNAVDWLTPGRRPILQGGLGAKADIQPRPVADLPAVAATGAAPPSIQDAVWPLVLVIAVAFFALEWAVAVRRG